MGALIGVGIVVWHAIAAVAVAVASAVAVAAVAIYTAIAWVAAFLWSAAVGVVTGLIEAFGLISGFTSTNILISLNAYNAIGTAVWSATAVYVGAVVTAFKTFLEVIHFKTLMVLNDIAYLLSEDYRLMMNDIYGKLAEFSSAIGLTAQFMALALRNARTFVLDVSTMIGRSYDLGEISWLVELNQILTHVNYNASDIAENPYLLFDIIDRHFVKPAVDLKAGVVKGLFTNMDALLKFADDAVKDVAKIKTDIDTFVKDLPSSIKKEIEPFISDITGAFDEFIDETYKPAFNKIHGVIDILTVRSDEHEKEVDEIVARLKKPADILLSVDNLIPEERQEQINKMYNLVNEPIKENVTITNTVVGETFEQLESVAQALETRLPPTPYNVPEKPDVRPLDIRGEDKSNTWQVGDY